MSSEIKQMLKNREVFNYNNNITPHLQSRN